MDENASNRNWPRRRSEEHTSELQSQFHIVFPLFFFFNDAATTEISPLPLHDALPIFANKDKMSELQVLYGRKRIESQLAQEKTKNKLSDKNRELESAQWRLILIIFAAISVFILGFLYIRYVRKSRKQQVLFSQRLIQQIDEERSRISGDLHDNIGQLLSVVKSKINMYNTGLISEITDLDKEVGEVINQTRTISHQLHPSSLEKLGLERSINGLLEHTQTNTDIICSTHFAVPTAQLGIEVQTQLYRISQECINNTIKHANAASLKITLKEEDGT